MIKNTFRLIILIVVLSLTSCATLIPPKAVKSAYEELPLQEVLRYLPAGNNIEHILLMRAILDHQQEGILQICRQLASEDSNTYIASHYALSGLVNYIAAPGHDPEKKMVIYSLHRALQFKLPDAQKAFLISQLQNCAGKESIPIISPFLKHDKIYEPAARALTAIGGADAGEALYRALADASIPQKLTFIKALGELKYEKAGKTFLAFTDDPNLRDISLFALANMGYPAVDSKLKEAVKENNNYVEVWLTFARARADKGDISTCETVCREIMAKPFPDQFKIAALTLLVEVKGQQAFENIVSMMTSDNNKIRIAALRLAEQFKGEPFTQKWIELLKSAEPEVQAEIINMLGQQGAETAVPVIREKLDTGPTVVRLAAISAITGLLKKDAIPELINTLNVAIESIERKTIKQKLLTLSNESLIPVIQQKLSAQNPESKIVLIDILNERNVKESLPLLLKQLDAEDEVRVAALEALAQCAGQEQLQQMIDIFLKAESSSEKRAVKNVIVAIVRNSNNDRNVVELLMQYYNNVNPEKKAVLFKVFTSIGGKRLLQLVQSETVNKELKNPAIRALVDWPDEGALDLLVNLAQNNKDTTYQILAIRGGMRLLRENVLGEPRAFSYCKQFMETAVRPEEKRLILSQLANIKSPQSLKYVISFLEDTTLNHDATLAAMKIATREEERQINLSPEQVALALIEAGADNNLLAKLTSNPVIEEKNNQSPRGFTSLFNGKDLTGWKGLVANPVKRAQMSADELIREQLRADSLMRAHWHVVDGVLYFDGHGASLCTDKDYANFEMWVDWKIEKFGDSGLYLRGSPQVQIWDPTQWPEGSGGLYNNKNNPGKPLVRADNPVGEWNTFHIIMRGERVTVWLNDVLVVDNVILENYWERDKPIYPAGQIELQAHRSPLYFKNIFIKELPNEEPAFAGDLFNGIDLTGWQVIGNTPDSWKVEDGILYTDGGSGGWISTTKEYDNFRLELEFRVPPDGNSGVFIRAPREGDPAYTGMEIQVLDDAAPMYATLQPWQYTGSIYGVVAPSGRFSKPANEWQKMVIVCDGPKVTVNLNDHEIINANLIVHMDQENTHPGLKNRKGYIGLQNHSTKIEYRKVWIEELK